MANWPCHQLYGNLSILVFYDLWATPPVTGPFSQSSTLPTPRPFSPPMASTF
ncbi:hypothetical protein O181_126399, partial [Austropuccinia psidii MF-1]|nr:hypothetical protein [Austropuccinia psidii MF-1]